MQRMPLGPTGLELLRERLDPANGGMRSTRVPATMNPNTVRTSQLQTYFEAAMDKFIRDREGQRRSYSVAQEERKTSSQERYVQDVEIESVELKCDRSGEHDQDCRGFENRRRLWMATNEIVGDDRPERNFMVGPR
uniref:Uncharacterized protein n=1 Tax=Hyaloperonospora arabidopsidis (strain Emoy2) TaxID=559515 RepID=M4BGR9_HYAAE